MKNLITYSLVAIVFLFASCRSKMPSRLPSPKQTAVDSIFYYMKMNQFDTEYFTGKFKAEYQMPDKKQGFSGQIRIKKDSVIWVSIYAMMNIEIFRLEVKPDSFQFINRLEKTYITESIGYFREKFEVDVDFGILQAILLGNDFPYYETDVFKLDDNSQNYQLSTIARRKLRAYSTNKNDSNKILVQSIWIDKNNFRIKRQNVKTVGRDKTVFRVRYDNFTNLNSQLFPMNILFKLKDDQNTFLEVDFNKVDTDVIDNFPFRIPSSYTEETFH